ncbi:hypothetical protein [Pararhizobium sp. PWRC1-1]|uniref:hypothetical protein n=1 Tax=Pararhizobium sp. PWRC1-1 TaxID=2804566 RepID=UPI003CEBAAF3
MLYDAALLQAYVNGLFDYARNEAQTTPAAKPSYEEMASGLKSAVTLQVRASQTEQIKRVLDIVKRRHM